MQNAADLLKNYKNFRAFCLTPDKNTTTLCNIYSANLFTDNNGDKLRFEITSNRFLKGMVRIIVGMLLEIGKGNLSITEFESYLSSKNITTSHNLAYPQGLYLSKIIYPFLDIEPRTEFSAFSNNNWVKV